MFRIVRQLGSTRRRPAGTPAARRKPYRPRLECLECRAVPTATTTTLTASVNPATVGQAVTFTATITGGDFPAGSPAGGMLDQVTFLDGATPLTALIPELTGGPNHESRAQFTTAGLGAGTHSITAQYRGGAGVVDSFNDPSTSNAVAEVVNQPPPPGAADVTALVSVTRRKPRPGPGGVLRQQVLLRNVGGTTLLGPLYLVLDGLPAKVRLRNAAGLTQARARPGDPYLLSNVALLPGGEVALTLVFRNPSHRRVSFTAEVFAGPGAI